MRAIDLHKRTISKPAIALAVISAVFAVCLVTVVSSQSRAEGRLQEQADYAALAGVNALAASRDLSEDQRISASEVAVWSVLADSRLTIRNIAASTDDLSVQVVIDDADKRKTISAVAHYVKAGETLLPQQSSGLRDPDTRGGVRLRL